MTTHDLWLESLDTDWIDVSWSATPRKVAGQTNATYRGHAVQLHIEGLQDRRQPEHIRITIEEVVAE